LLGLLHGKLSTDCGAARARIDAHLLACWVNPALPDPLLVLSRSDTYHYHNLPDLSKYLRQALSSGDWGSNIVTSFMAVYCLQLKKQKRCFKETSLVERAGLINLLHGLLLGLYPYNTRHLNFEQRVKVAGALRVALVSGAQLDFILKNESLVQFAVVEYLANVLPDFFPVEDAMLVRGVQSRFSVNQVCENFRVLAMAAVQDTDMWSKLTELASLQLPALHRQLKVSNLKLVRRQAAQRIPAFVWPILTSEGFYDALLDLPVMPVTGSNMIAQIKLLFPDFDFAKLQAVEFLWSNVALSLLPQQTVDAQRKALRSHGSCQIYQRSLTTLHACLPCALRSKNSLLTQKFAYNCASDTLQCATCSRHTTPVHMLGRVLAVRDVSYYLCAGCLKPTVWKGDVSKCQGCEKKPERQDVSVCVACNKKAVEVIHKVIDLDTMRLAVTPLCFQHAKHCVVSRSTVYDTRSLMRELYSK